MNRLWPVVAILVLFLLYSPAASALSGQIVDPQGDAIEGVSVTDGYNRTYSDGMGKFSLDTDALVLHLTHPSYIPKTINTADLDYPIRLDPKDITLPSIWVRAQSNLLRRPALGAQLIYSDTNEGAGTAADLLLTESSVSSTDISLSGERQTLSLLGSFNRHSLVIIDGVPQNTSGEAFDFATIPTAQIEYIEIIKGNTSAYGGSGAIGGVIHIHTIDTIRRSLWEAKSSFRVGSFDAFRQNYALYLRKAQYSIQAEYIHSTAHNDFEYNTPAFWNIDPVLRREHNRKNSDTFFAKASYYNAGNQIEYGLSISSFQKQLPGPINFLDLYDASRLTGGYAKHNLRLQKTGKLWLGELLGWWNHDRSIFRNIGSTNPFAPSHYSQDQANRGLSATTAITLDEWDLKLKAEYQEMEFIFDNYLTDIQSEGLRDNSALSLRAAKSFYPGLLELKSALVARADYGEDQWHPTGRLELELSLPQAEDLLIGGYLGTAYSQPSLFDMYWIGDSETMGNPLLKSESSAGFSIYASYTKSVFSTKAAYYYNNVDDLIQWRQYYLNGVSWRPFNVGKSELQSLELSTEIDLLPYLVAGGSITFTKATDYSTNPDGSHTASYGKTLVYTPDKKAVLNLKLGDYSKAITLRYQYTGSQYSTVDNLIEPLDSFDSLDASAFYLHDLGIFSLRADLQANNILNRRYEIYSYTPQPGFNWSCALSLMASIGN